MRKNQHVTAIKQSNHQQRTIAAAGKARSQALHQRVKFRQMALRFLLPADQISHFAKRLLSHHQRALAVAEGESSSGRNTRQLFRRRSIPRRPDQKRRLHLRQQLQIGLGTQPDVNHRIR